MVQSPHTVCELSCATDHSANYTVQVSDQPSLCKLDQLPMEIFDQMIYPCEHEASLRGQIAIGHNTTNDGWLPVKPLRLVNKPMSILVSACLFKFITLYQHAGYWELFNVANAPTLAPHMDRLKVAHIGYVR